MYMISHNELDMISHNELEMIY